MRARATSEQTQCPTSGCCSGNMTQRRGFSLSRGSFFSSSLNSSETGHLGHLPLCGGGHLCLVSLRSHFPEPSSQGHGLSLKARSTANALSRDPPKGGQMIGCQDTVPADCSLLDPASLVRGFRGAFQARPNHHLPCPASGFPLRPLQKEDPASRVFSFNFETPLRFYSVPH